MESSILLVLQNPYDKEHCSAGLNRCAYDRVSKGPHSGVKTAHKATRRSYTTVINEYLCSITNV